MKDYDDPIRNDAINATERSGQFICVNATSFGKSPLPLFVKEG
jgi:hypothetical protein